MITRMTLKELSHGIVISKAEEVKKVEMEELFTVKNYLKKKAEEAEEAKAQERKSSAAGLEKEVSGWPSLKTWKKP